MSDQVPRSHDFERFDASARASAGESARASTSRAEPKGGESSSAEASLLRAAMVQAANILATLGDSGRHGARIDLAELGSIPGYDLLGEVHRGGQGIVLRAVQRSTGRIVAIKILRRGGGADSPEASRIGREARILARLNHPNIVAIHDSGEVAGRVYLVMDFIQGKTVDDFISVERPALPALLALFATIADALHAAHLRGIIHRDLKPANVLIDADGRPHILDFGLAKLTAPEDDTPISTVTMTGAFIGTLPWASPEQADGRVEDLDVRSDVYSLAVMLYRAVTGSFPYRVTGRLAETAEAIRSAAPPKPSSLRPGVDRDLETILLKALSKEPARRYQSASDFGRDLRHFLNGEPIDARRDSAAYLLRKTIRRHRVAAIVALAFLAVVSASAIVLLVTSERARRAAARSVAINRFFVEGMLVPDPLIPPRSDLTVAESLDRAAERIDSLRDDPELEAATRQTLGVAYRNIGRFDRAEPQFRNAWRIRERMLGPEDEATLESKRETADMVRQLDHPRESQALWREIVETETRLVGAEDPRVCADLGRLAWTSYDLGDYAETERLLRAALEPLRRSGMRDDPYPRILADLGTVLSTRGDLAGAATVLREATEIMSAKHGADHPLVASTMLNLAAAIDDPVEAERLAQEARRIWESRLGPEHPLVARALNLIALQRKAADPKGASELFDRAIAIERRHPGEHLEMAMALMNAAGLLRERGMRDAAEPMLAECLEIRRRHLDPTHPDLASAYREAGMLAFERGRFDEAAAKFTEAVRILEANPSFAPMHLARTKTALGQALRAKGDLAGAATEIEESLELIRAIPCAPGLDDSLIALGRLRLQRGDPAGAETALRECLEIRRRELPAEHWAIGNTESVLAGSLIELKRLEDAEPLALAGYEKLSKARGADDPKAREAADRLAVLYDAWGKLDEARRWRERGAPAK